MCSISGAVVIREGLNLGNHNETVVKKPVIREGIFPANHSQTVVAGR